jgi:hypothetical protein
VNLVAKFLAFSTGYFFIYFFVTLIVADRDEIGDVQSVLIEQAQRRHTSLTALEKGCMLLSVATQAALTF